jgi:outer membrane protein
MFLRNLGLGVGVFGLSVSLGIPAFSQSLDEALVRAYNANPTLNAQRAATRVTDENVPQALSGYRPTITATGDVTAERQVTDGNGSSTVPRGVGIEVGQTLFDGFRTANSVRAAESGVLAARAVLANTEQNILLRGVEAYMNVLRDVALLNLQTNNVQVLDEQLRQTNDRFAVGDVTKTDVGQANARLEAAKSSMLAAKANLKSSRAVFRQIIGSEPKNLKGARPLSKLLPKSLDSALAEALEKHPAIIAALHGVDAATLQIKVAEGALYPTVSATASLTQRFEPSSQVSEVTTGTIGARISIPIFEGGLNHSKTRAAKETLSQRRIEADETKEQVRAAVVSAWGGLESASAQIEAANAQVAAAELALAGVREEAKAGQRTTLDVLNAQQEVLNAKVNLVTAQRDRVVASYSLASAVGRLSAQRLGLKVASYDAKVHYEQVRNKWIGTSTPDGQ